ncbi:MAG: cobalamin biosynthesis protein [Pikeienuella sp.]
MQRPSPEMPLPAGPHVVYLTASAAPTAHRLAAALGGVTCDLSAGGVGDTAADRLRTLFLAGRPLVGVMAAGILIRALAPVLTAKALEPPVLAVAEDLSVAVPLLGGHRGANALAAQIAEATGATAAVTTAGEIALGVALDAPAQGWRLETPEAAKPAMAGLLDGRPARLSGEAAWLAPLAARPGIAHAPAPPGAPVVLEVEDAPALIYRQQRFALGVGCARGCGSDELIGLVGRALADGGLAEGEIAAVHSIDLKADEAAVHALAEHLRVPARFHPAVRLEAERARLTAPSAKVFAEVGCHGVAEGAALAAAGPAGRLVLPKAKSAEATCAVAEIAPGGAPGRPRGRLAVVGLGPGSPAWRTPEAARLIAEAEELVGYGLYIDLAGALAFGKRRTEFPLGGEEDRCRHALERAGEGNSVALLCSGDPGIYAMAALVMELLDRGAEAGGVSAAARRAEIVVAPGISALQAASARAGALLGHDFCAVSLSDLLTPRETVLARLEAAAAGDFVVALYNPVSAKRRDLLELVRGRLLAHRPGTTPVLLARNLGRADERLLLRDLDRLSAAEVDMLTVVLVGAKGSRVVSSGDRAAGAGGAWVYTPRGYAQKSDAGEGGAG